MNQALLPPPSQPGPGRRGAVTRPLITRPLPVAATPAAERPRYEPEPPRKPSPVWAAVKWPIRQALKLIYLGGSAVARHRAVAAALLAVALVLGGGTYAVYHFTHPAATASRSSAAQGAFAGGADTPFTITSSAAPPLSPAVIHFLHAWKTYDAAEARGAVASQAQLVSGVFGVQAGATPNWQDLFGQARAHGIFFQQFVYTGGYAMPDGTANFTVQVVAGEQGKQGMALLTWYFVVDARGHVAVWQDLTQ